MTREEADTLREKTIAVMQEALRQIEEKQELCEDAISRKSAQEKLKAICDEYGISYYDGPTRKPSTGGSAFALGHAFDDLSPVTPIRPKGEWLPFDRVWDLCSECGEVKGPKKLWNYCPRCGTNMQEDNNADCD